jgi:exoribonuclease-2
MDISSEGALLAADVYQAKVNNQAKLTYSSVAMWLDGKGNAPPALSSVKGLQENLRLQDRTAQAMKNFRRSRGAPGFETVEARPVSDGNRISDIEVERRNRARNLIEEFMIGANVAAAGYLAGRKFPFLRRVVRTPKRWERIVELAKEHGFSLPHLPDARALGTFLIKEKGADPGTFPDLFLAVIRLIGSGEHTADPIAGNAVPGHFSLGAGAYAHATAPNRRYSDFVTQRLLRPL